MNNIFSGQLKGIKLNIHAAQKGISISFRSQKRIVPFWLQVNWEIIENNGLNYAAQFAIKSWVHEGLLARKDKNAHSLLKLTTTLLTSAIESFVTAPNAPSLPPGKTWITEQFVYMGAKSINGYLHGKKVQIRFVVHDGDTVEILPDYTPWKPSLRISTKEFKKIFVSYAEIEDKIFSSRNDVRKPFKKENIKAKETICYNPKCEHKARAIRSHILQQKGTFNHVIEETSAGKVIIELTRSSIIEQRKSGFRYKFFQTGVRKSNEMAFWGFCPDCDRTIFGVFERKAHDFTAYHTQLLLSYRAHLNELSKQEYNVHHFIDVIKDPFFPAFIKEEIYGHKIHQTVAALVGYSYKSQLEKAIEDSNSTDILCFKHFILPKVLIATSAVWSKGIIPISIRPEIVDNFSPGFRNADYKDIPQTFNYYFLHLIPTQTELEVIIGYSKGLHDIEGISFSKIDHLSIAEKFKLLSDIIIKRLETWCVAPSVMELWKQTGQDIEILKAITYHLPYEKKHLPVSVNLFEGLFKEI